ncbi:MAG: response regulator transcription factor [Ilumatobacteraceae bacterium]|nr:response regulator transcription factor [Ilumatobacteraceae bacterium]
MRVLLVEDEVRLAAVICEGLDAEGIDVDIEHDGADGLWRATEGSYDVIVLDIMLPSMNGYVVCRELRANGVWTPVLMLTAKDGEYDEAEALDTGADDFLRKPFSFVVLLARLRALARRRTGERPTVLQCGTLRLDPATAEVSRGGQTIDLTRREMALLEVLMRADGDAVARSAIIDHVWGIDDEPASNVVDVYIRYLRRKVDDPFDRPIISTVRGVGYRAISDLGS